MRASKLVPKLADEFCIPQALAGQIDRAFANAGYREKGKGRAVPDMTRREAVSLAVAFMACDRASDVPEAMRYWSSAYIVARAKDIDQLKLNRWDRYAETVKDYKDRMRAGEKLSDEENKEVFLQYVLYRVETKELTKDRNNIKDLDLIDKKEMSLVDYLVFISDRMNLPPHDFTIELNITDYTAEIRSEALGMYDVDRFECRVKPKDYSENDNRKSVIVRVDGEWLKFIADHTEPEALDLG
ncbi:hypothetical protein [Roseibium aggregatum]|uniref:hypothetical protein n=1 Tax=Roseibium aggregatum TaxID=187304 RepID=UPI001E3822F0|nr:hypothetical protein [Roseibium aggregatum]UES39335.1 hypothetical protein GFC08_16570 [Roseibium aggregatum]